MRVPRPYSLVVVIAVAVALVGRGPARAGARVVCFVLGIKALALQHSEKHVSGRRGAELE